jgi:tripartite-type tricarboxylate transporter receptor subunit TctC
VPFAAGSFTDLAGRTIALELAEQLGQQVIVENRTGAGGTIGADAVAKSPSDGYTLLISDNSLTIAPGLYPKLPYDAIRDLAQVSLVAESPSMLIARPAFNTVQALVAIGRAKPGELTFGSGGQGSSAHLATEFFLSVANVKATHVPYKGAALAVAEVGAGRIDMSIASLATAIPPVRGGKALALAVSGAARSPVLPEVPTFAESGFGEYNMSFWWGVMVPAATPGPIIARLNAELARAAGRQRLQEIYAKQGARAVTSSPAELTRRVEDEAKLWKELIGRVGVKLE